MNKNNRTEQNKISNLSLGKGGIIENREVDLPEIPFSYKPVNVEPKTDMVIIQGIPPQELITKAGIIIPIGSEQFKDSGAKGVVVRVGKNVEEYKAGDLVLLAGNQVFQSSPLAKINDIDYFFIYQSNIVGKYDNISVSVYKEEPELKLA